MREEQPEEVIVFFFVFWDEFVGCFCFISMLLAIKSI